MRPLATPAGPPQGGPAAPTPSAGSSPAVAASSVHRGPRGPEGAPPAAASPVVRPRGARADGGGTRERPARGARRGPVGPADVRRRPRAEASGDEAPQQAEAAGAVGTAGAWVRRGRGAERGCGGISPALGPRGPRRTTTRLEAWGAVVAIPLTARPGPTGPPFRQSPDLRRSPCFHRTGPGEPQSRRPSALGDWGPKARKWVETSLRVG